MIVVAVAAFYYNHIIGFKSLQGGLISSLDQQIIELSNKCTSEDDQLSLNLIVFRVKKLPLNRI